MSEHRNDPGLDHQLDGLAGPVELASDVGLGPLGEVLVEGRLVVGHRAVADQHRGEVRPADLRPRAPGLRLDLLERDVDAELVEPLDDDLVAVRPVVLKIGKSRRQAGCRSAG